MRGLLLHLEHPEVLTSFHSKTLLFTVGNVYEEVWFGFKVK